jgi:crotonobetainyl-CoA:carnitine CoA-transferase CaiB-like acyl-CoA transferase
VGHDLNFVAISGLLELLPGDGLPRVQIADVVAGLLAGTAVLAALLDRNRTGRGGILDQPLVGGSLPLLAWPLADLAAGGGGLTGPRAMLTGGAAAYGRYRCADGLELAVGALEPKFWVGLLEMLGLSGLEGEGLDTSEAGRRAAEQVAARFATRPRGHWLEQAERRGLPLTPVHPLAAAASDPVLSEAGVVADRTVGPFFPSIGRRPDRHAPRLGEHDASLAREFALDR